MAGMEGPRPAVEGASGLTACLILLPTLPPQLGLVLLQVLLPQVQHKVEHGVHLQLELLWLRLLAGLQLLLVSGAEQAGGPAAQGQRGRHVV